MCYEITKMAAEDRDIREPVGVTVLVSVPVDEGVEDGEEGWERGGDGGGRGHCRRRDSRGHDFCVMVLSLVRCAMSVPDTTSGDLCERALMNGGGRWT